MTEKRTGKKEKRVFKEKISLTEGVSASMSGNDLVIKGKFGESKKEIDMNHFNISIDGQAVQLETKKKNKEAKKLFGSLKAHIKNMVKGAFEGHSYKLKVCSSHFPMSVTANNNELIIKNFFGERHPRKVDITPGVKVKVQGQDVVIESSDKELAGQFASVVEKLTKRTAFDKRIFMDGLHITEKAGKEIK